MQRLFRAACGPTAGIGLAMAATPSGAATPSHDGEPTRAALEDQIQQLQRTLDSLLQQQADQQRQMAERVAPAPTSTSALGRADARRRLTLDGGVETAYQIHDSDVPNRETGGEYHLYDYILGASGQYDNLSFETSYWFQPEGDDFLQKGHVDYQFGADSPHRLTAGYFQVPFGYLTHGYESFYGNIGYHTGFADSQAAGVGDTYAAGPWRFDLDALKNNNLGQVATYDAVPVVGYAQINGGNTRLAYTIGGDAPTHATVSAAAQGGQIEVGGGGWGRRGSQGGHGRAGFRDRAISTARPIRRLSLRHPGGPVPRRGGPAHQCRDVRKLRRALSGAGQWPDI